jgi:hypothetical protein
MNESKNSFIQLGGLGINKDKKWEEAQERLRRIKEFSSSVSTVNTFLNRIHYWESPKQKKKKTA